MKKILCMILFLSILFFQSCFEQNIVIDGNEDLSGTVSYKISLSNDYLNSVNYRDKTDSIEIRNIINKDDIQKNISGLKTVKLEKISQTIDTNGEIYEMNFKFTRIEDLKKVFRFFFVENTIYIEQGNIFCKSRLVLNFIGDPKKIRAQYAGLDEDEKKIFDAYMSIIKIRLKFTLPASINQSLTSNGILEAGLLKEFAIPVFENDIANKLDKDDKTTLLGYFVKTKSGYSVKSYLSDEEINNVKDLFVKSGFKNIVTFEKTLLDVVGYKEDPEFTVVCRKL